MYFAFKINYNTTELTNTTALFNGNISETHWKTANDNVLRNYRYDYDALNRIVGATSNTSNFNLSGVRYDKMGNIEALTRKGQLKETIGDFGTIDNLVYKYDLGNKLKTVTDSSRNTQGFNDGNTSGDDYAYDVNGNLIEDKNKNIKSITYNHLNLPVAMKIGGSGTINYVYSATGEKLSKASAFSDTSFPTITEYANNFIYKGLEVNPKILEFINHPEGYLEPKVPNDLSQGFNYVYQYKDHLGNIRLSYADDNNDGSVNVTEIREEKNYYPFGLTHKGYNNQVRNRPHNYGYNGKEQNDELGLTSLDYGARNYDPALGRWFVSDALADDVMQVDKSPYAYSWNSPVALNDPDGNCPWCIGAVIGAAVEYTSQVVVNVAKNGVSSEAFFDDVNFSQVAVATVAGALTGGASALATKTAGVATKALIGVAQASITVAESTAKQALDDKFNGDFDGSAIITDVVASKLPIQKIPGLNKLKLNEVSDATVNAITAKSDIKATVLKGVAKKNIRAEAVAIAKEGGKTAKQVQKAVQLTNQAIESQVQEEISTVAKAIQN